MKLLDNTMSNKLISFLYHEVTDDIKSTGFQTIGAIPYKHSISHFKDDLTLILNQFEKSENIINLTNRDKSGLILTFDDEGKSAINIANILRDKNLIGHFFITTSMIGKSTLLF